MPFEPKGCGATLTGIANADASLAAIRDCYRLCLAECQTGRSLSTEIPNVYQMESDPGISGNIRKRFWKPATSQSPLVAYGSWR